MAISTPLDASPPEASNARAFAWMSVALVGFLTLGLAGRALARDVSLYQLLVYRNAICLVFVIALLPHTGLAILRTRYIGRHLVRNACHIAGQYLWFFAVVWLPLTEVFAIEFTTPIWTALFAATVLGERMTRWRTLAIALGFTGVLLILRPGASIIAPASLAAVGAAVCFAVTYCFTKALVAEERPMTILFWMHLMQLPMGLSPALVHGWVNPPLSQAHLVAAIGIAGFATHYCIARAMRHADATVVAPLDFLRLPIGAVIGWAFYAEALDPIVVLGAALILTGNWTNLRRG